MKRIVKCIMLIIVFMSLGIFLNNIYAATANISASKTTAYVGDTVTINVSINAAAWNLNVSGNGINGGPITGFNMEGTNQSTTKSYSLNTSSAGTYVISLKGDVSDGVTDVTSDISKSVTVTISQKPATSNPTTSTTPSTKPQTNNTTTNKTQNTNTNTNTNTKSSNANLKSMILNVEGLSPAFAKNITNYSLNVGENVNEIKVNAAVEHSRASYTVSGNTNLKDGENIVTVKVTAENGTVKTYTINVIKSDDPVKSDATLSSLIIEDVDLGQVFDPNVTEYNAGDIKVKADKLNIYAYTTADNAKVEIIGNEELKVGEQKVTIRVTSENGKVVKDYVVSFNKLYSEDVVSIYEDNDKKVENKTSFGESLKNFYYNKLKPNMTVIILYFFIWVEFIQVVYLYTRLKKYEDLDKITVGRRIKDKKVKEKKIKEKVQKTRRNKVNPVFPEDEN